MQWKQNILREQYHKPQSGTGHSLSRQYQHNVSILPFYTGNHKRWPFPLEGPSCSLQCLVCLWQPELPLPVSVSWGRVTGTPGVTVQVPQTPLVPKGKPLMGPHRLSEARGCKNLQGCAEEGYRVFFKLQFQGVFFPFLQSHKQFSKVCESLSRGTPSLMTRAAPGFAVLCLGHISSAQGSEAQTPLAQRQGDALERPRSLALANKFQNFLVYCALCIVSSHPRPCRYPCTLQVFGWSPAPSIHLQTVHLWAITNVCLMFIWSIILCFLSSQILLKMLLLLLLYQTYSSLHLALFVHGLQDKTSKLNVDVCALLSPSQFTTNSDSACGFSVFSKPLISHACSKTCSIEVAFKQQETENIFFPDCNFQNKISINYLKGKKNQNK